MSETVSPLQLEKERRLRLALATQVVIDVPDAPWMASLKASIRTCQTANLRRTDVTPWPVPRGRPGGGLTSDALERFSAQCSRAGLMAIHKSTNEMCAAQWDPRFQSVETRPRLLRLAEIRELYREEGERSRMLRAHVESIAAFRCGPYSF